MDRYKQNLHTHSTYCDGKDTPEELVLEAIKRGHFSIGFSGHSYMRFSAGLGMDEKKSALYKEEIFRLKGKYKDVIKIYYGLEKEMYSDVDLSGYDYLIGSCHYLDIDGEIRGFDRSLEVVANYIADYFGGDGMLFAKKYYETLSTLPKYGNFDIIGHFDLITKHADSIEFFNENSKEYISYAVEAAEALAGKIPLFEVNTGAAARGYRKTPYPRPFILKELKRLGFGAVIASDCHDKNFLDCGFKDAESLLLECGFKERYVLTDNGFTAVKL